VSGVAGVGKSTLINNFLGLTGSAKAKVGVVETTGVRDQKTMEPHFYSLPGSANVRL